MSTLFTPEQIRDDGQNRVAKTTGQSGASGALIIVSLWLAHQCGWNGEMPAEVTLALGTILTGLAAAATNLKRLRAK